VMGEDWAFLSQIIIKMHLYYVVRSKQKQPMGANVYLTQIQKMQ